MEPKQIVVTCGEVARHALIVQIGFEGVVARQVVEANLVRNEVVAVRTGAAVITCSDVKDGHLSTINTHYHHIVFFI